MGDNLTYLDALRKRDGTRELAVAALANGPAILVAAFVELGFTGDGEHVVVDINVDVLLLQPWELEGGRHGVGLGVLMNVHPGDCPSVSRRKFIENSKIH